MSKKKLSFEDALKQLETIAEQIELGQIGLEESIEKYELGMALVKQCRDILSRAELRIEQLQEGESGKLVVKPLDLSNNKASEELE
ncbi:MAG: exodeoxyribonuclease VII small subunit [Planctomycetes bacterium]|nr:exodeoxyribonuclease VII small subunit [Planctomycetota bacterium]MBI3835182.1 exodeoxyribonuclease VII small subunit [Planctomycetota bacterium]